MSPIYGLTDGTPTFREVGRIRKGGPKTDKFKPGPNLDHFRATFRDDEREAAERFAQTYGDQPTLINVRMAFNNVEDNWSAWYTAYLKGGMLGMADGRVWHFLRDYRTQQVLIKNGSLTELGKERGIKLEFSPEEPVYFYHSERQKQDMPVFAKPEGKLRVVLPELGRYAFMVVLTHSLHDIANISSQLAGIAQLAADLGLKLSQMPLVLTRRVDQISKPIGNGRGIVDEWLIHIEVLPDFAPIALKHIDRMTVQTLTAQAALPQLPAETQADNEENTDVEEYMDIEDDGEVLPGAAFTGQEQVGEPEPELLGAGEAEQVETGYVDHRQFTPEIIGGMMQEPAAKYSVQKNQGTFKPRDKAEGDEKTLRSIVAANLERCFAGEDDAEESRRYVTHYLFGIDSLTELDFGQLVAIKRWLNSKPDSGGDWVPDGMSIKEAKIICNTAIRETFE